jgi:hypothetical protein
MDNVEEIAKAFCEASGLYKWDDTRGSLREWYLKGAEAIHKLWDDELERQHAWKSFEE